MEYIQNHQRQSDIRPFFRYFLPVQSVGVISPMGVRFKLHVSCRNSLSVPLNNPPPSSENINYCSHFHKSSVGTRIGCFVYPRCVKPDKMPSKRDCRYKNPHFLVPTVFYQISLIPALLLYYMELHSRPLFLLHTQYHIGHYGFPLYSRILQICTIHRL